MVQAVIDSFTQDPELGSPERSVLFQIYQPSHRKIWTPVQPGHASLHACVTRSGTLFTRPVPSLHYPDSATHIPHVLRVANCSHKSYNAPILDVSPYEAHRILIV